VLVLRNENRWKSIFLFIHRNKTKRKTVWPLCRYWAKLTNNKLYFSKVNII
jgi:hypothetical protein